MTLDRNGNARAIAHPRDPERAIERMQYDKVDRMLSKVDPFDPGEGSPRSEWRYRYDANSNQTEEIRPRSLDGEVPQNDFTTTSTYDRADQLESVTNGAGHRIEYDYDRNGNQTRVSAPGAARQDGAAVRPRITRREFDGRDLPWTQTTGTGQDARTTITEFDGNGNLRRQVNPEGVTGALLVADPDIAPDAEMTPASRASRHATVNEYDDDNLLTGRYLPWDEADDGERWKQTTNYNSRGWTRDVSEIFKWTGANGPAVRTSYDYLPTGWVSKSTDKDGSARPQVLLYAYDLGGNQTRWTSEGKTRRVEREFFPNGELETRRAVRLDRANVPVVGETRTYDYERNPAGELTRLVDQNAPRPNGAGSGVRETSIGRDVTGRIRTVNELWENGRDTVYRYATGGLIDEVSVDGSIVRDASGRITGYDGGRTMAHSYDILDRVKQTTVRDSGAEPSDRVRSTRFAYWPSDEQRSITKTNDAVEERFFADDGRITQRMVTSPRWNPVPFRPGG